jgi:small subunit ribosomal protein S16
MAVSIRLRREGARNRPYYKVVVADSRSPRDGKFIEIIGTYDPKKADHNSTLKLDRIDHWISQGAQPSDTVRSLIKKNRKQSESATPEVPESVAAEAPASAAAETPASAPAEAPATEMPESPAPVATTEEAVVVEPAAPTTAAEESAIAAESPVNPPPSTE